MSLLEAQLFLLANQGFQLHKLFFYRPQIILKLCLQSSYYSRIILTKLVTYYSYNYASILGAGLLFRHHELLMLYKITHHLVDINADDLLLPLLQYHSMQGNTERILVLQTRVNAYSTLLQTVQDYGSPCLKMLLKYLASNSYK